MVYRHIQDDDRWHQAHEHLPEQELPERYRHAFALFEQQLRASSHAPTRPLELREGSEVQAYYPDYDAMKLESLPWAVITAAFLWIMGLVPLSLLTLPALLFLPHAYQGPVVVSIYGLGALVTTALFAPTVRDTWRRNRRRRAASGRMGFGSYLLTDAIVVRTPDSVSFYPRDRVTAVEIERLAARRSGGGRTSVRHHAAESRIWFHYVDALARQQRAAFLFRGWPGHDPEPAHRLQAWVSRDASARADPGYRQHTAADCQRPEWAAAWRSFRRRRAWTYVLLVAPLLLIVGIGAAEGCTGGNVIDDAMGPYSWLFVLMVYLPALVMWLLARGFRCPRCGKSPRQPLSGTDVTRCLSCGLPIYTKVPASSA